MMMLVFRMLLLLLLHSEDHVWNAAPTAHADNSIFYIIEN